VGGYQKNAAIKIPAVHIANAPKIICGIIKAIDCAVVIFPSVGG